MASPNINGNKPMKPGIYYDISNDEYHSGIGISKSGLDLIAKSPAHYKAVVDGLVKREPTKAQSLGTAFHELLLEPELFWSKHVEPLKRDEYPDAKQSGDLVEMINELNKTRLPKLSASGSKDELIARIIVEIHANDTTELETLQGFKLSDLKNIIAGANEHRDGLLKTSGSSEELAKTLRDNGVEFKLWSEIKAEYAAANESKTILDEELFYQLINMRDAVYAHPSAHKLLTKVPGKAEVSAYWHDPETGELCRVRPDFWREDGYIVDLKTTTDASPEGFAKSVANWNYHMQAPYYMEGITYAAMQADIDINPIKGFVFLAVEKDACVVKGESKGVGVYILDDDAMEQGRIEFRKNLNTYVRCSNENKWPGYSNKVEKLSLPKWAVKSEVE